METKSSEEDSPPTALRKRKPVALQQEDHDPKSAKPTKESMRPSNNGVKSTKSHKDCPFLSTIKRHMLDFDHEKCCSVTLATSNVYCCLVCGKFYQGRGRDTLAYKHALEIGHYMYINLQDERVYCLPDNYEVEDKSLADIKVASNYQANLRPRFTVDEVKALETEPRFCKSLDGRKYLQGTCFSQGFVGLNNLNNTDHFNVILQSLLRIKKLRDFYLLFEEPSNLTDSQRSQRILTISMAQFFKKVFNPINFKNHVSPHELLQAVSLKSGKQFSISKRSDPLQFLAWLLNSLHQEMKDKSNRCNPHSSAIIFDLFQGSMDITRQKYEDVDGKLIDRGWENSSQTYL